MGCGCTKAAPVEEPGLSGSLPAGSPLQVSTEASGRSKNLSAVHKQQQERAQRRREREEAREAAEKKSDVASRRSGQDGGEEGSDDDSDDGGVSTGGNPVLRRKFDKGRKVALRKAMAGRKRLGAKPDLNSGYAMAQVRKLVEKDMEWQETPLPGEGAGASSPPRGGGGVWHPEVELCLDLRGIMQ